MVVNAVVNPPHVGGHFVVLCRRPDLELDPRNLVTLCVHQDCEHHVLLGHLDDYESYNPDVLGFVRKYARLTGEQIRSDPMWQKAAARKPKHFDDMSKVEKAAFKKMLDAKFPVNVPLMAKAVAARGLAMEDKSESVSDTN